MHIGLVDNSSKLAEDPEYELLLPLVIIVGIAIECIHLGLVEQQLLAHPQRILVAVIEAIDGVRLQCEQRQHER